MVGFDPSVSGNLRHLQRQIDEQGTGRLGPVSIGPGEGSIRAYTGTGDTFKIEPSGASFAFQGSLTGLSPHLEANAVKNTQQDGRLTSAEGRLSTAEGRLNGHDNTLASHNTRITAAQTTADGAVTVNNTQNGRLNGHDTTLGQHNTRITTAQTRADKGVSDAATAQARANAAYNLAEDAGELAGGAVTPQQLSNAISSVQGTITALANRVLALEQWRDSLPGN